MRRYLALVVLLALGPSPAFADSFSFEGFYLGMPRVDATRLRPAISWQPVTGETPSEAVQKEFTSNHLGREARVSVGLDRDGQFVRLLAFTFLPQSDSQCILEAVAIRLKLERLYGTPKEASSEQLGKRVMWSTSDGVTIRWLEACTIGARQYFVTYARPAG
jgi:hypothetical protein